MYHLGLIPRTLRQVTRMYTPLPPCDEELPAYGWRVAFTHRAETSCKPFGFPRLSQLPDLLSMSLRYFFRFWLRKVYKEKRKPFIDGLHPEPWQPIYGAPLGGIGGGTIGRGYRGEFCRFNMVPGIYEHTTVQENQFIVTIRRRGGTVYQQVLSPHRPESGSALNAWNWNFCEENGTYLALYPRSWTVYDIPSQSIRLLCRQISPMIPHDYKDSCLPCAVFVWRIINHGREPVEVTITFTFKNGVGRPADAVGGVHAERVGGDAGIDGSLIHQSFAGMPCTYGVAASRQSHSTTSVFTAFDPCNGQAKTSCFPGCRRAPYSQLNTAEELPGPGLVWEDLMTDGQLHHAPQRSRVTRQGEELATAVACQCEVDAGAAQEVQFALTWHMPKVHFKSNIRQYTRRYSRWFDSDATKGTIEILKYALNNFKTWEEKIDDWQRPILENSSLPDWYKSAIFNELYFVADGGSVWLDRDPSDMSPNPTDPEELLYEDNPIKKEIGWFGYLEGHEYRMYCTYDVHYYASWALVKLWPKLQMAIQYDFAKATVAEDPTDILYIHVGNRSVRNQRYSVPHDLGDPEDEPWVRVNAYVMYSTHDWKDLNPKFVLSIYRDWKLCNDRDYLTRMFPLAHKVMQRSMAWDRDGDGLIENGGFADQTYDAWCVTGPSAYCGGLWLGALYVMREMALELDESAKADEYSSVLKRAREAYETRLWTGSYYQYDCSNKWYHRSIMCDQLNGHWYVRSCGAPKDAILPHDRVCAALNTIYQYNCVGIKEGKHGAINGAMPSGGKDISSVQSEEHWVGVNYSTAATMIREGMLDEGFNLARGAFETVYHNYGLQFQTPESFLDSGHYRSLGYMRPLSIWAIQHVLDQIKEGQ